MLVKFETYFDGEYWCARGIGQDIFTQGKSLDELQHNIQEAVAVHFGETSEPIHIVVVSDLTLANAKAPAD
ncbi:MAG: type II toxin-antitoxin system HicB family antitoxin [bacterium]